MRLPRKPEPRTYEVLPVTNGWRVRVRIGQGSPHNVAVFYGHDAESWAREFAEARENDEHQKGTA